MFCEIVSIFEDHYPETLKKTYVVNGNMIYFLSCVFCLAAFDNPAVIVIATVAAIIIIFPLRKRRWAQSINKGKKKSEKRD